VLWCSRFTSNRMDEFIPEDLSNISESEQVDALSNAFFAAGLPAALEDELDDEPVEPLDV